MLSRIDRRVWQMLFWLCWLICSVLFLLPATELPVVDIWDKALHATAFALLMLLAWQSWRQHPLLVLVGGLMLYGFSIECLQHFIPGRSFSLLDTVADAVGVLPVTLLATGRKRL